MLGSVTLLFKKQNCGFILAEDGCEVFFDSASLGEAEVSDLHLGQWVEFDVQYGAARTRAIHI